MKTNKIYNTEGLKLFLSKKGQKYNVLTPTKKLKNNGFIILFTELKMDPKFAKGRFRNNDFLTSDEEYYFLTPSSIKKIMDAAGITIRKWKKDSSTTPGSKGAYFIQKIVDLSYFGEDGFKITNNFRAHTLAHAEIEKEKPSAKIDVTKEKKRGHIKTMIDIGRREAERNTESEAILNGLKQIFPRLQHPFKQADLEKPFLVGRVVPDLNRIFDNYPHFKDAYEAGILEIKVKE